MTAPKDFQRVLALIQGGGTPYVHFFSKINSAVWLPMLASAGYFRKPPPPSVEADGSVSFPWWAESSCLARLAERCTEGKGEILTCAVGIPPTENVRVVDDIIRLALCFTSAEALPFAPMVIAAIESQYGILDPIAAAKFAAHLALPGQADAPFEIAEVLLAVAPPDNPRWGRVKAKNAVRLRRGDTWEYGQCLAAAVPLLASVSPARTVELLVGLLTDAVALSQGTERRLPGQDHSEIWLRDLGTPEHPELDLRVMLARRLRSVVLDTLTAHDSASAAAVLAVLHANPLRLLRRIEMDALAQAASHYLDACANLLANVAFISDEELRREYVNLAKHSVPLFGRYARRSYLKRLTSYARRLVLATGKAAGTDAMASLTYKKLYLFKLLHAIEGSLTEELKLYLEQNSAELAPLAAADDNCYLVQSFGAVSPLPPADLAGKSPDDLLAYLRTWTPKPTDMFGPSRQGLAEKLKSHIEANWPTISATAEQWIGLHSVYVNALFTVASGTAMAATPPAGWHQLCKLANLAVNQPCEALTETWKPNDNIDRWRWIRVAVCRWLQRALDVDGKNLPADLADSAWAVIDTALDDDDPPPDSDADLADMERNHFDRAINTTRGAALEAAFEFAKWSWYRQGRLDASINHDTALLDTLPAVKAALERCLDPTAPRAVSLHAIFGQRLDQLMALDQEWTSRVLPLILPQGGTAIDTARRRAAWEGYTLYSRPTRRTFRLLRDEYHAAVGRLTPDGQLGPHQRKAAEYLADHVLSFYINGLLELDGGTLPLLFERAPLSVRTEALRKMGQELPRVPRAEGNQWPDEEAVNRILALWKWRTERLDLVGQAADAKAELAAFAPWFSATTLPADWRLGQLLQLLEHGVAIDLHSDGTKELVNLAAVDLKSTLRCMEQLLGGAAGRWLLSARDESVPKFFEVIAQSRSAEDLTHALRILDQAGRNGALWLLPVSQKVRAAVDGVGR